MSEFSSQKVEKRTNMLKLYSQIVTAVGFFVIIVGAIILIATLVQEFSGDLTEFQVAEVGDSVMVFVYGIALTAIGSALAALRTIAVNCARLAEKESS